MTQAKLGGAAPFFIVSDVPATLAFYRDKLGFEISFQGPPDDVFFGIVRRDDAMLMFKALGAIVDGQDIHVEPMPNYKRKPASSIDAHIYTDDPDALAAEFAARGVRFTVPLTTNHDQLRGFELQDPDGYGLFFGRPAD